MVRVIVFDEVKVNLFHRIRFCVMYHAERRTNFVQEWTHRFYYCDDPTIKDEIKVIPLGRERMVLKCPFVDKNILRKHPPNYVDTCSIEHGIHCHGDYHQECPTYQREIEKEQKEFYLKEFRMIPLKEMELDIKDDKTPEDVIEYETYALLKGLLDLVEGFESGNRIVLKIADHGEILRKLKYWKNHAKRNIEYLQEIRERKEGGQ